MNMQALSSQTTPLQLNATERKAAVDMDSMINKEHVFTMGAP